VQPGEQQRSFFTYNCWLRKEAKEPRIIVRVPSCVRLRRVRKVIQGGGLGLSDGPLQRKQIRFW
jgi:hypothetical protein